ILLLADLIRAHGFGASDVARIDVAMASHSVEHGASIAMPSDAMGAQVSLAFSLGLRLVTGRSDLSAYADPAMWRDERIARVARVVHVEKDDARFAGASDRGCRVRVALADGRVLETHEDFPKGQPENALSRAELEEKFRSLASAVVTRETAERVLGLVDRL